MEKQQTRPAPGPKDDKRRPPNRREALGAEHDRVLPPAAWIRQQEPRCKPNARILARWVHTQS